MLQADKGIEELFYVGGQILMDILFLGLFLITWAVAFIQIRKYENSYHYIHQGLVNQFGTMAVKDLNRVIAKQFSYYSSKNEKTPLVVKYNVIVVTVMYIVMIRTRILPLHINFFTLLFSFWLLLSLSQTITEAYMYHKISQEYTDDFWQKYIDNNKENKLKVVVHYAYTPREVSHLRMLSYLTFAIFIGLICTEYIARR